MEEIERDAGEGYVRECLETVLRRAEENDYRGFDKHDALNSPVLEALSLGLPFLRLAYTQAVMRAPVNPRPLLGVRESVNPKSLSLFARAWFERHRQEGDPESLARARTLLDRLRGLASGYFPGIAWGHPYPWQEKGFFSPRHFPNRVVTCFCGEAFADAWDATGETRDRHVVAEVARFLTQAPGLLLDNGDGAWVTYVPMAGNGWIVLDASAITGAFLARAGRILDDAEVRVLGRKLIAYVAKKQTDEGGWYYAYPPRASHVRHENHPTGFILDAILEYGRETGDDSFLSTYRRGLSFYADELFLPDGAPRRMSHRTYPHDVHDAAQGILTFSRATAIEPAHAERARRILGWALANLHDRRGFFCYQKGRSWTKRFRLLGWADAWMALALATFLGRLPSRRPALRRIETAVEA
ncbi:MAG: hypothetical protein JXP34_17060 [Planctomycetes bacterium]|nr:hypothetical protein [Planctomycetota bacterium]